MQKPSWPHYAGFHIQAEIDARKITSADLADLHGLPEALVYLLRIGLSLITTSVTFRPTRAVGTTAEFRLNIDAADRFHVSRRTIGQFIHLAVPNLPPLPQP